MRVPSIKLRPVSVCCLIAFCVLTAGIARLFALPMCTKEEPDPNPPACGGSFSKCEDYTSQTSCPATPSCIGEYPSYIPKTCVAGSDPTKWCTNGQQVLCRLKADCHWEAGLNPHCVQDEWCQVIYDSPKVLDGNCVPPS
jgi:hypothetical protein